MRGLILATLLCSTPVFAETAHQAGVKALEDQARLDAASAEKVQSIVDAYRNKMAALRDADRTLLRDLKALGGAPSPDGKRIDSLSAQLLANRKKLREMKAERMRTIEKAVTPVEFARVLTAQRAIDREYRRELRAR